MAENDVNARMVWERCEDKTLYFTLSLYVDREDIPADILSRLTATGGGEAPFADFHGTRALRDAIDPLFNDIANRERLGRIEDFLLDVEGRPEGERVRLHMPRVVRWTTEGATYQIDLGEASASDVRIRRFWYAYHNGALSYHLSFAMAYTHDPLSLYAISMLQKAAAPKEFRQEAPGAFTIESGKSGILPLDQVTIEEACRPPAPFWAYIKQCFERDASQLFGAARNQSPEAQRDASFAKLVKSDNFLEVPGLAMPRARFMFFFYDRTFFEALLPPLRKTDAGDMVRVRRMDCVRDDVYARYPELIQQLANAAQGAKKAVIDIPLQTIKQIDPAHLRYLFLAGFNQNIIDFINQDASEVLDSTDPIYPATAEQEEESFFVRFANPRSLTTFVAKSRSLETGADWIGTCPYAFLIHVLALHNEFFVRGYESEAEGLVHAVQNADEAGKLRQAAQAFYGFRKKQYSNYMRNRYQNVFRYDTEKDVFEELEAMRGIAKKVAYVEALINGVEKQTHDLEERLAKQNANRLAYFLALLSIGGFTFDFVSKLQDLKQRDAIAFGPPTGIIIRSASALELATLGVMGLILAFLLFGLWHFLLRRRRD